MQTALELALLAVVTATGLVAWATAVAITTYAAAWGWRRGHERAARGDEAQETRGND